MATTFDLCISCERSRLREADSVLRESHARIALLERELSEFLPSSPVYRLNQAPAFSEIRVPASVIELLELSQSIAERTRGAFDCTVKSGPFSENIPVRLQWNRDRGTIWKTTPDAHLSFGAIGKGFALDSVRSLIERLGFTDYLLNAGGSSIVFSGFAAPGEPWTWAWSWKKDERGHDLGIVFDHFSGERISLGVSGLHEKGRHLVDPRTGEKSASFQSALVAHPSAGAADALSTALFVSRGQLPREVQSVDSPVPLATASIDETGVPRWNGWFQKFWGSVAPLVLFAGFWISISRAVASGTDDEAVDLGALGVSRFNPYLFERHGWLVVLPLFALFLVLIHLIRIKIGRNARPSIAKMKKGTFQ